MKRTADTDTAAASSTRALLKAGAARLERAGRERAWQEASWLLGRLMGAKPLDLRLENRFVPEPTAERFHSQIGARATGVPLQYLLGEAEFFGESFLVRPGVFIPRPETESVVEAFLAALGPLRARQARPLALLDAGTGSGCIAITLARRLPPCVVTAVEVSCEALSVARANILRHGVGGRIHLVRGRWLQPIRGLYDAVISNPPYIPTGRVEGLPVDVRQEPRISLDGGTDGMRDLLQLLSEAPRALRPGGLLALECGEEQTGALVERAAAATWVETARPLRDLAGRPRGLLVERKKPDGRWTGSRQSEPINFPKEN